MRNTPKILIVDDTPVNIELIENVLATEGFATLTSLDGPTAAVLARVQTPDLILLDVLMPEETGFQTCARLKSDPATADIPIIFLSSLDDTKSKVTGLKIGGVDYISKPVHGEELLARVRIHLRIADVNRKLVGEHRSQMEALRVAQQGILVSPETFPDAAFGVYYKPLEHVGGDFYDVVTIAPGVYGYFVADISGHGVSASFLTSAVKALLRRYATPMFSPEDTMRGVDAVMRQMLGEEQYLTACYAQLNRHTGRLSVINAGHPPLILVSQSGETYTLELDSEPLGVFSSTVLQHRDLQMFPGDRFFLYTDGLIESKAGGGRGAGHAALQEACLLHHGVALNQAAELIAHELWPDAGAANDDLLLMAVDPCQSCGEAADGAQQIRQVEESR
jgi:sigma-B regulation protein RsbU (phosphoserine phosphatase)